MRLMERVWRKANEVSIRNWDRLIGANGGVLAVVIDNKHIGLFAHLNVVVRLLREAEDRGVKPIILCESQNYQDLNLGRNWLSYFFVAKNEASSRPRKFVRILTHRDLGLSRPDDLCLREARSLLFRHFAIREDVIRQCDEFCTLNGITPKTLAVHYRGTDKVTEAPRVAYQRILDVVEKTFWRGDHNRIFLATDEEAFVEAAIEKLGAQRVVKYDIVRSSRDAPLHLGTGGSHAYNMGRSALLDCLTLSRCGAIVRTASLLSSWVSIFNPKISVTLLNTAYDDCSWWPERLIASTNASIST